MATTFGASWAEYLKMSAEALAAIKALYPLLPKQNKDEVEAKIEAAERTLKLADANLWKSLGFELHDCQFPPPMMFRDATSRELMCSACGFKTNHKRSRRGGPATM